MTNHVDWFLAASEETDDLERRLHGTVGSHLIKVGVTNACLALVCVRDRIPNLDLASVVTADFVEIQCTTEELSARTPISVRSSVPPLDCSV